MKVKITLITRNEKGRKTTVVSEGTIPDGKDISYLRGLWEAEHAINDGTSIRCHIEITE